MTTSDLSPVLGNLDKPTRDIAAKRVKRIFDGLLDLSVERARIGLSFRYPTNIRICRGLSWSGSFYSDSGGPELPTEDVLRYLNFRACTPKERAKALFALARIEKWVSDRLAGLARHANNVREQQGIWVEHLNSTIAMDVLEREKHRFQSGADDEVPF